jgi:hypothetical protein
VRGRIERRRRAARRKVAQQFQERVARAFAVGERGLQRGGAVLRESRMCRMRDESGDKNLDTVTIFSH